MPSSFGGNCPYCVIGDQCLTMIIFGDSRRESREEFSANGIVHRISLPKKGARAFVNITDAKPIRALDMR